MMRPKRTCTAADTASAAPAKRLRRGAGDSAVSTGKAATGVEENGAGPAIPCVQVTTSRHIKGAAAESQYLTSASEATVASPCGKQAGPAAPNSEQAAEPSARGHTAACSAARVVPSLPAAGPACEPEQSMAAAAAAAPTEAAVMPPSSARTAAQADKSGDTEKGINGDADLTERLRSATRCFKERHAGYTRLYECVPLSAAPSSPTPVLRVMKG